MHADTPADPHRASHVEWIGSASSKWLLRVGPSLGPLAREPVERRHPRMSTSETPAFIPKSMVLGTPAAAPEVAHAHFARKLEVETDPSDVAQDLKNGIAGFVLIDVRAKHQYDERHATGAISIPRRTINAETTSNLSKGDVLVLYCWCPACNGATKAAVELTRLGFRVKEMIGGIEYWVREGYPVEGTH